MQNVVRLVALGVVLTGAVFGVVACGDGEGDPAGTGGTTNVAGSPDTAGVSGTFPQTSGCGPGPSAPVMEESRCFTREELKSAERGAVHQGGAGGIGGDEGSAGQVGESNAGQSSGGRGDGGQSQGGHDNGGQSSGGQGDGGLNGTNAGSGGEQDAGGMGGAAAGACPMLNWQSHPGIETPWTIWRGAPPTQEGDQCCYVLHPSCS